MESKKLLVLLVALTVLINYQNYFKESQNSKTLTMLQSRIASQKALSKDMSLAQIESQIKTLQAHKKRFIPKGMNFSKAMGKLQSMVEESAKEECEIKSTKWASYFKSPTWFELLKMDVVLECDPKKFARFTQKLQKRRYFIDMKSLIMKKYRGKMTIMMRVQSYKVKS